MENFENFLKTIPEQGIDYKGNKYNKIALGTAKNLANQTFGALTPLFRINSTNNTKWLCVCECGNLVTSSTRDLQDTRCFHSCGCKRGERQSTTKHLEGQRFGRLLVEKRNKTYAKEHGLKTYGYWDCICDCGKRITVQTHNLTSGNTISCGCYKAELIQQNKMYNYIGKQLGLLTVIGLDDEAMKNRTGNYTGAIWKCKCKCGNIISVRAASITDETIYSCGCERNKSSGENKICEILENNHIKFLFDNAYFKDLYLNDNKTLGRYDFILFNDNNIPYRLIEYDGEGHYEEISIFENNSLEKRKKYDSIKNNYAKNHNLPLVRIPYWEKKNITFEMLMGDEYLVT